MYENILYEGLYHSSMTTFWMSNVRKYVINPPILPAHWLYLTQSELG